MIQVFESIHKFGFCGPGLGNEGFAAFLKRLLGFLIASESSCLCGMPVA